MNHTGELTEDDLKGRLAALGLPDGDERLRAVTCSLIGHSRIVTASFGYISCARCDAQIGDTLLGSYIRTNDVIVGHNCDTCQSNYEAMGWQDKFMVGNPFTDRGEVQSDD